MWKKQWIPLDRLTCIQQGIKEVCTRGINMRYKRFRLEFLLLSDSSFLNKVPESYLRKSDV